MSRSTAHNVHIICIFSDNMRMTCTYVNNSSRNEMYIIYAFVDNIQMTWIMCVCGDNVQKLSCR